MEAAEMYREPGTSAALRWVLEGKIVGGRAVKVVEDGPERTLLAWWEGCRGWTTEGLLRRKKGDFSLGTRWEEARRGDWELVEKPWSWSRVLFALEPGKYYGISLFWDVDTGKFRNFYVNFQLPFQRSHAGFDSLDLDLDIIVADDFSWQWKDEDDWAEARASGMLSADVIEGVERARSEVVSRIEEGLGDLPAWADWEPDPSWGEPCMPENWDSI